MPQVTDPVFSKTLIFMIDHNTNGAFGVIINKKINQNNYKIIKDFLPNEKTFFSEISDDLFFGGPMKTKENIIIYLSSDKLIKLSMAHVDKNGTIKEKSLKNNKKINNQVLWKKITGFSSWGPGQLENEIKNGDWIPKEKENNIIFSNNPERSWEDIIKSIGIDTLEIATKGAQA
tara:strand:+ start:184 stop:708 length:525 start_codon:yes stop_codon:yes gene_type:complete